MKQTIKLSESELKRVIAESVKRVLKESGNTKRGSYLMGRAGKRNLIRGDISNFIDKRDKASNKDAFNQGMEDQTAYGINLKDPSRDRTWDMQNNSRLKFNYNTYKMEDMDELGRKFIDFIEKYDGGALMQTVVDYESGNQTGKKESPLKEIIPYFEEEVLGYDCTPDMIDAIRRAYNQWWFYAEDLLMPYDEDEEDVHESINRKINRIVSESIRRNLRKETVKKVLREDSMKTENNYRIVAYLIDPSSEWQKSSVSGDDYAETVSDYDFISDVTNDFEERMKCLEKYSVTDGAIERHYCDDEYIIDEDADGIYLLKRI